MWTMTDDKTLASGDLVSFWEPDLAPSSKTLDCFERRVRLVGVIVKRDENLCSVMSNQKFYSRKITSLTKVREQDS